MKHSRDQWANSTARRRYERREKARIKAERDQLPRTLKASQTRVRELEAQLDGLAIRPKVDVVPSPRNFLRPASAFARSPRVLTLLAGATGHP